MIVTYIHHSCFCVEIEDKVFVFDYFNGAHVPQYQYNGKMPEYPKDQEIYVFSSHQHGDHFDADVFDWAEKYEKIQYVFPKDMKFSESYFRKRNLNPAVSEKIHYVKLKDEILLDDIRIETLISTDEGVAFLVTYKGKTIYHAGDLHWWHWDGEDPIINEYQEKNYKRQIDRIKGRHVDVAFVVIDNRLKEALFWGIDYFMEQVDAEHVIPMHLWKDYEIIPKYKQIPGKNKDRIVEVTGENQVFTF